MCTRDMEHIRCSRYVDECCQIISEAAEYPTDVYAVHIARFHGLADMIMSSLHYEDDHATPALNSAPIGACVKSLESELLQLKGTLLNSASQNGKLR